MRNHKSQFWVVLLTWYVSRDEPADDDHTSVVVYVQERHLVVLLPQHKEHLEGKHRMKM